MHFILVIIGIGLLIGLLFRSSGDLLLDTIIVLYYIYSHCDNYTIFNYLLIHSVSQLN
jgi:hypothetical protein